MTEEIELTIEKIRENARRCPNYSDLYEARHQCKIWDNECGEIQCPLEPPKMICCAFCELFDHCCEHCPELSSSHPLWLSDKVEGHMPKHPKVNNP